MVGFRGKRLMGWHRHEEAPEAKPHDPELLNQEDRDGQPPAPAPADGFCMHIPQPI